MCLYVTSQPMPEVLVSERAIRSRVDQLALQISSDYAGVDDLLLVGVLRGAFIFLADLSRRLTIPRSVDFIAVSSYGQKSRTTGAVRMVMDLRTSIDDRHVLVVVCPRLLRRRERAMIRVVRAHP